jgi:hypothetical protein
MDEGRNKNAYIVYYTANAVIQKQIAATSDSGVITYLSFLLFDNIFMIVLNDR